MLLLISLGGCPCSRWSFPLGGRFLLFMIDDVFVLVLSRRCIAVTYISSFFTSSFLIFVRAASADCPFLEMRRVTGLIKS